MSKGFLINTFTKISPAYEQIADIEVTGSAVTSVDFTGLNITKEDDYILVANHIDSSAGGSSLRIFANNNYTTTNYYSQQVFVNGTGVSSSRQSTPEFVYASSVGSSFAMVKLKFSNNWFFNYQANGSRHIGTGSIIIQPYNGSSIFTMTSITSIRISASVTNGINVGSRFQLYKRVAPIIADIEITSATTQVDITGLDIDKDSEYMLVSDIVNNSGTNAYYQMFANNNTTQTNYYSQYLDASNTVVSGTRINRCYYTYVWTGYKVFNISKIKLTNNNLIETQNDVTTSYGTSSMYLRKYRTTSTFTATSITSLNIVASVANGIGIGSRFQLIKLK